MLEYGNVFDWIALPTSRKSPAADGYGFARPETARSVSSARCRPISRPVGSEPFLQRRSRRRRYRPRRWRSHRFHWPAGLFASVEERSARDLWCPDAHPLRATPPAVANRRQALRRGGCRAAQLAIPAWFFRVRERRPFRRARPRQRIRATPYPASQVRHRFRNGYRSSIWLRAEWN